MDLTDLITPNNYVGQNFPLGMSSTEGGDDPLAKLRELLGGGDGAALPPNAEPTMGQLPDAPTDISARTRQPLSVPLPAPRPADAPAAAPLLASPADITAFAPTDIQRAQMGRPPIPQTTADIVSAITGRATAAPDPMRNIMASLGGGLSTVTGNTAGGAFARGAGGSLKAGAASSRADSEEALKHLKAALEAQQLGDKQAYTRALTSYYGVLTKQKNEQENVATAGPKPPRAIDSRLIFDKAERAIQNANRAIDGDFRLKPEERAQKKAQEAARIYKGFGLNPDGTTGPGAAPSAPSSSKKAGNPGEIAFNGDGTQAAPYEPRTKDDYDQIESGSYYIVNGQLRRKK
ncbi:hypothetical protein [Bradyrhizobium japonicum]|uniref:hypothetical protein n=1 Tax=Bradyrhizobium japonicum TaxID=375 RepID=UPI00040C37E4|nr:hypothetical protein [Bradyrhizobium japonicum]